MERRAQRHQVQVTAITRLIGSGLGASASTNEGCAITGRAKLGNRRDAFAVPSQFERLGGLVSHIAHAKTSIPTRKPKILPRPSLKCKPMRPPQMPLASSPQAHSTNLLTRIADLDNDVLHRLAI
jgi:hypothetical protein